MSDIKNNTKIIDTSLFLQNLVKLIPVEIIAIFTIIKGIIPITASPISILIIFGILLVLIPFYAVFAMKIKKAPQVILMTVVFPIWILALGGLPIVETISWYQPWIMSVGLALFTLIPPMFYGRRLEAAKRSTAATSSKMTAVEDKCWREI